MSDLLNVYRPEKIHLTEIEKPSNMSKVVEIDARPVSAGQVSLVPHRFYLRCPVVDEVIADCSHSKECKLFNHSKSSSENYVHHIGKDDPRIIALYKKSDKDIKTSLAPSFPCQNSSQFYECQVEVPDVLAVREAVFYPSC